MKPMVLLAMIFSLTLGSCKKGWFDEENGHGGGGGNGGGNEAVTTTGVVERVQCGVSVFGSEMWIRTSSGILLQPCMVSSLIPMKPLQEGDKVEVVYRKYTGNMLMLDPACSKLYIPNNNIVYTKAIIDFIKIQTTTNGSCPEVTIINTKPEYDKLKNTNNISVKSARIEGSSLLLEITYGGCNNNTESIKLVGQATERSDLLTYQVMAINEKPQGCKALITANVCFDLSMLKATIDGYIRIHVEGTNQDLIF